jgi:hypothetical protein
MHSLIECLIERLICVSTLRGIMELLDVMKLDMANFHIQQMRPHIQLKSIEYERKKFKEFLDSQSSNEFVVWVVL